MWPVTVTTLGLAKSIILSKISIYPIVIPFEAETQGKWARYCPENGENLSSTHLPVRSS